LPGRASPIVSAFWLQELATVKIALVDRELGNTVSVQRSLRSYPRVLGAASKPPVVTLDQIEHRID